MRIVNSAAKLPVERPAPASAKHPAAERAQGGSADSIHEVSSGCQGREPRASGGAHATARLSRSASISPGAYPTPASSSSVCSPRRGGSSRTPQPGPVERDRKERRLHGLPGLVAVGQHDVGEAAGGLQMRIVVEVFGLADRRERQAGALEDRRQLGRRCDRRAARAASRAAPGARARGRCSWPAAGRPSGRQSRARRRRSRTARRSRRRGRSARRP